MEEVFNPSAFPIRQVDGVHPTEPGMTLLDYFAGQALAGLLASDNWSAGYTWNATESYLMADAMLKLRTTKHQEAANAGP